MSVSLKIAEKGGAKYDFQYTRNDLPSAPVSPPKAPVSPPRAPVSPPKAPVSPPRAPISPPKAPISPPRAPVSPLKAAPKRSFLVKDLFKMKIGETPLVTIRPDATLLDAVKKMKGGVYHNYASRPDNSSQMSVRNLVVMDGQTLVGICGQGDLTKALLADSTETTPLTETTLVSKVMTPNPICVLETDSLLSAFKIMMKHHIRHLVVRNEVNVISGVISKWDILEVLRTHAVLRLNVKRMKDLPTNEIKKLITVKPTDTILAALKTMAAVPWPKGCPRPAGATQYRIRSLAVVDDKGIITGIVTQGDFVKCILNKIKTSEPVGRIMTPQVIWVDANETVSRSMNRMSRHGIRHIFVDFSIKPLSCYGPDCPNTTNPTPYNPYPNWPNRNPTDNFDDDDDDDNFDVYSKKPLACFGGDCPADGRTEISNATTANQTCASSVGEALEEALEAAFGG